MPFGSCGYLLYLFGSRLPPWVITNRDIGIYYKRDSFVYLSDEFGDVFDF